MMQLVAVAGRGLFSFLIDPWYVLITIIITLLNNIKTTKK